MKLYSVLIPKPKGVSGYKKSANDRDAIIELECLSQKSRASNGEDEPYN